MKRLIRSVARLLYPRAWQQRYGAEFEGLIEDAGSGWRDLLDVASGGLRMQMSFRGAELTIVAVGLACGILHSALSPARYEAVVHLSHVTIGPGQIRSVFDRKNLYQIIQKADLYSGERSKRTAEDLTDQFRHDVLMIDSGRGDIRLAIRNPNAAEATRGVRGLAELLNPGKTLDEVVSRKMGKDWVSPVLGFGAGILLAICWSAMRQRRAVTFVTD
jgi:hypothetical protein